MAEDYMIPTSVKEVEKLGWDYIDVIIFSVICRSMATG